MLKESFLEFSSVAEQHIWGRGVAVGAWKAGRTWGAGGPKHLIGHIKPDWVMVSQEFTQFKIARSDGDEIGGAKDAVDSSLVDSCLVGSGGEVSWS